MNNKHQNQTPTLSCQHQMVQNSPKAIEKHLPSIDTNKCYKPNNVIASKKGHTITIFLKVSLLPKQLQLCIP